MKEMNSIVILLSSYNGEKFIKEQIDSILSQTGVEVFLYIRDDGSTDGTINILNFYNKLPNCEVVLGENIGARDSFLWLIENAPECEYYAFSDQDDIWNPDKLSSAILKLNQTDSILYHGLAGRVDKELNPLQNSSYIPVNSFGASLLSSATGCTMVFTNELMSILKKQRPKNVSMHDAWVYRSCYALGYKVYYDEESHMQYRQHDSNVSGGQMSFTKKIRKVKQNSGLKYAVALDIKYSYWNEMPEDNRRVLTMFLGYKTNFKAKIKAISSKEFNQRSIKTNIQNKLLFLLNLI